MGSTEEQVLQAAYRLLSYRPRSRQELRSRLERRFPPGVVGPVLERLEGEGFLDDETFARLWAQSRQSGRPRSAALVRQELEEHGVAREVAVAATLDLSDEEGARQVARRFARTHANDPYGLFRRRLWGYLRRRGFSPELSRRLLEETWRERGQQP